MFVAQGRKHSPPVVVGMLLVSSLIVRCASKDESGERVARTDAAVTGVGGQSQMTGSGGKGTGGEILLQTGGSAPIRPSGPFDGGIYATCQPGSVDRICTPPKAVCQDPKTLALFTAPQCVDGTCQWTRQTLACAGTCKDGACDSAGDASSGRRDAGGRCDPASAGDASSGDANAGSAAGCDIPASICVGTSQLLYFVNPRCVDGTCRTTAVPRYCSQCVDGACVRNFTL